MGLRYDEINKGDFIEILNDLMSSSNTYKSSELHDCYFRMMVDKLRMDTNLNFYYRSGEIVSESLGVKVSSSQINSYDDLLEIVEKVLVQNEKENKNEYGVECSQFTHIEHYGDKGLRFTSTKTKNELILIFDNEYDFIIEKLREFGYID